MKKGDLFYKGSIKSIYETTQSNRLIQEFRDVVFSDDKKKKVTIKNKGKRNNKISSYLFEYLESYHVPNHFVRELDDRSMLIRKMEMIPIEIIVRNIASGDFCKRFNIEEGMSFECPIIEHYLKVDNLRKPMINEYHACALGFTKPEDLKTINRLVSKVNVVLKSFFERRKLTLIESKLEFGYYNGGNQQQILLGDEISFDTCKLWDRESKKTIDKENFLKKDTERVNEIYDEILKTT